MPSVQALGDMRFDGRQALGEYLTVTVRLKRWRWFMLGFYLVLAGAKIMGSRVEVVDERVRENEAPSIGHY